MYVCIYMCVFVCVLSIWSQRLDENVRSPGTRDIGACEPSNLGAENQMWVFWKSSKWSESLSHLSNPRNYFWPSLPESDSSLGLEISSLVYLSPSHTWGPTLKPPERGETELFPRWLCQGVGQVQNVARWGRFLFRSLWNPQVGATALHSWQCFGVLVKPSLGVAPYYQSYGSY